MAGIKATKHTWRAAPAHFWKNTLLKCQIQASMCNPCAKSAASIKTKENGASRQHFVFEHATRRLNSSIRVQSMRNIGGVNQPNQKQIWRVASAFVFEKHGIHRLETFFDVRPLHVESHLTQEMDSAFLSVVTVGELLLKRRR